MRTLKFWALALALGATALANASWVKWADVDTTLTPGAAIPMADSQLHFITGLDSIFGDVGQFYLQISANQDLTAYDYTGVYGGGGGVPVADGSGKYQWLLNNIQSGTVMDSLLRGSSATDSPSETILNSDGLIHWYYSDYTDTPLLGVGFTGRFRLVDGGTSGKLNFEAEAVPEPFTMILGAGALALALKRRLRKKS